MFRHHGEVTEEDFDHYDVPEWGPESPVLACRGYAAERPDYWRAMCRLLVRGDELPLAVLIFTDEDRHFRRYRESLQGVVGRDRRFARQAEKNSPNGIVGVPKFFADCFRPEEEHRSLPGFDSDPPA